MTEETKKLFNAPWAVDEKPSENFGEVFDVMDEDLYLHYARCYDEKTANRVARLPELYDALANAVRDACQDCVDQVYDHPIDYDPVEYGCLFKDKNCCEMCRSWIELLRKVRGGEGVSETNQN